VTLAELILRQAQDDGAEEKNLISCAKPSFDKLRMTEGGGI
jgi:hypothetical protein